MIVGYVFDENFIIPASVSIVSLFMNNRDLQQIDLYILDDGISSESREKLLQLAKEFGRTMTFIDVQMVKERLSRATAFNWNGSYSTYIRLMLTTLLPEVRGRIIMIDADTIIDGSITELDCFELDNNICAMALEGIPECYHKYSALGDHELYNGGIIIVDLKKWQDYNVEERIIDYLTHEQKKNMLTDEDVLSKLLQGKVARIPAKYNYLLQFKLYASSFYYRFLGWDKLEKQNIFYALEDLKAANREAVIFHCIDTFTNRPWHKNNIHPFTPLFDTYLAHTPWKNEAKKARPMRMRSKMEYYIRKILPYSLSNLYYAVAFRLYFEIYAKLYYRTE